MAGPIAPTQRGEALRAASGVQTARRETDAEPGPREQRLKFSTPLEIGEVAESEVLDDLLPVLAADSLGG